MFYLTFRFGVLWTRFSQRKRNDQLEFGVQFESLGQFVQKVCISVAKDTLGNLNHNRYLAWVSFTYLVKVIQKLWLHAHAGELLREKLALDRFILVLRHPVGVFQVDLLDELLD